MAYESDKEVAVEKYNLTRAVIFTLLGVLVCVTLVLIVFQRPEEQQTTSETAISSLATEIIPAAQSPLDGPANEMVVPATSSKPINSFRNDSEIALIKPFEPDVFLSNAARFNSRRDWLWRKVDAEKSEEEDDKDAKASFGEESIIFRNLQLKDENGEIPLDGMEKAREHLKAMQAEQQRRAMAAGKPEGLKFAGIAPGDWVWQGPGNIGGRIRSIVIHPTNPNKMWVGSVAGGIWKTTDAGTSWLPVNDFLANLAVATMVIDPTNPNTMYAGTGEAFITSINPINSLQGTRGDGILKSTDGGATWVQLAQTKVSDPAVCPALGTCPWTYVNRLAISPNGTTILAATASGIHRSIDGGATWTRVTANLNRAYFDIDFDPTNSQLAIAGSLEISVYTIDGGQTWTNASFPGIASSTRVELAYAQSSPNIVYASVAQNGGEVYRSTTGGQAFTQVNTGTLLLAAQGNYTNIIWVNPQDPTFVLVGGVDVWKSTDSGQNFTKISNWPNAPTSSAHADQHMIVAHPGFNNTTNKTVYFGNDGGLYRTNDVTTAAQTTGWTNMNNGLGITQFYGAAGNSAGVIVGGTQDNGTLKSNPTNTNAWTTTFGGDGGFAAADPIDPNYFYTQ